MSESTERIRAALSHIPADDRDLWVKMGMAIKSELGASGFDIWDTWSQQADNYNVKSTAEVWRSINLNSSVSPFQKPNEAQASREAASFSVWLR